MGYFMIRMDGKDRRKQKGDIQTAFFVDGKAAAHMFDAEREQDSCIILN